MNAMKAIEPSILSDCLKSFTVDKKSEILGTFIFPPDFTAFQGHFLDQPVLPAVIQIAAVRLLASRHLGIQLLPTGVQRAKFKRIIVPEMVMVIRMHLKEAGDTVTISFTIETENTKAAVGVIECRKYYPPQERKE